MPYCTTKDRKRIDRGGAPQTVGELTYKIYRICLEYLRRNGRYRYQDIAEIVAALENTKLEFYRVRVAPYEDRKRRQNGDVRVDSPVQEG